MTTTRIERARVRYLPLLWPERQSGAAVEHNDVILTLGSNVSATPIGQMGLEMG